MTRIAGTEKVEALIRVASRLIALLEREAELLRAMKAGEIAGLQKEKNQLVVAYEEQVRALAATPEEFRRVAPALREEFALIAERFDSAMTENRRALSAATEAQNRFLQAVMTAVQEKQSSFRGYSAKGTIYSTGARQAAASPVALSLDRHF
jgi:flagellar biosynthesis/type III secretory pathway chaperone